MAFDSERINLVLDASSTGMLMVDANGIIVIVNKIVEKKFGYSRADLVGQNIEMLIPERYRTGHFEKMQGFSAEGRPRPMGLGLELFGLKADGQEIPIEIELTPVDTSTGRSVIASIMDITEQKRAEERFRTALDAAPVGMLMVSESGEIIVANQRLADQFGYLKSELIGKKVEGLIPTRFRPAHPEKRQNFMAEGKSRPMASGLELYGLKNGGEELPIQIELTPVMTSTGPCVIAAVIDITEKKEAESEIERRSQEIEQFVYAVSHDLKSPIVTTMGFLEYLKSDLEAGKLDRAQDSLKRIYAAGSKMSMLIQDLLHFSRVGYMDLTPEIFNMDALIASIHSQFQEQMKEKQVTFSVGTPLGSISGDENRISQVFENLIGNAIKYGADENATIEVGTRPDDAHNIFYVMDNGPGIAAEYHDKIFELFQRLDSKKEGTGVGLAIVNKIVSVHGGKVWLESEAGKGATFWIQLPKVIESKKNQLR